MKHPALARVFAIVLAILGLLLLITGVRGFEKTGDEHEERLAYEKKYEDRIENFAALREELPIPLPRAFDVSRQIRAAGDGLQTRGVPSRLHTVLGGVSDGRDLEANQGRKENRAHRPRRMEEGELHPRDGRRQLQRMRTQMPRQGDSHGEWISRRRCRSLHRLRDVRTRLPGAARTGHGR